MIELHKLRLFPHQKETLNTQWKKGSIILVLGKNGSGKSQLARSLCLLSTPCSGSISIDNKMLNELSQTEKKQFLKAVSFVSDTDLYPHFLTVEQFLYPASLEKDRLDLYQISNKLQIPLKTLSRGEKKQIQLVKSLALKPRLIIWDNPFLGLNPVFCQDITQELLHLRGESTTIILSDQENLKDTLQPDSICYLP